MGATLSLFPKKYFQPELMINSGFWEKALRGVTKPQAVTLRGRLSLEYPLGINPESSGITFSKYKKEGSATRKKTAEVFESITETVLEASLKHPEALNLCAVGDFYEAIGVHATLISQITGLRAMGNENSAAKCGAPLANLQQLLNMITDAGFDVVVCEQADVPGATKKKRYISQVVTPDAPTYIYAMALDDARLVEFPESRSVYCISEDILGLNCYELAVDSLSMFTYRSLTIDALYSIIGKSEGRVSKIFLDKRVSDQQLNNIKHFVKHGDERSLHNDRVVETLALKKIENEADAALVFKEHLKLDSSQVIAASGGPYSSSSFPLHLTTADQIGLIPSKHMPDLLGEMMGINANETSKLILRRILLTPPGVAFGDKVRDIISVMSLGDEAWPDLSIVNIARFHRTIKALEANSSILRDLRDCLGSFLQLADNEAASLRDCALKAHELASKLLGVHGSFSLTRSAAEEMCNLLTAAVSAEDSATKERTNFPPEDIRNHVDFDGFLAGFTGSFLGKLNDSYDPRLKKANKKVKQCEDELKASFKKISDAVSTVEAGGAGKRTKSNKTTILIEAKSEQIVIKPSQDFLKRGGLIPAKDRYGKAIEARYTTLDIENARIEFLQAVKDAEQVTVEVLREINVTLEGKMKEIIGISQTTNLIKTLLIVAEEGARRGWSFAVARSADDALIISDYFPFWMRREEAVVNSLHLDHMGVLFGGNLGGKSTTLRSLLTTAILAENGMPYPASGVSLPAGGICGFYLRTGAQDDPKRALSSWGVEASELYSILKEISIYDQAKKNQAASGAKPVILAFIDEIGKGTDSVAGTAVAACVLAALTENCELEDLSTDDDWWKKPSNVAIRGLFATHWHELSMAPYDKLLAGMACYHMTFNNGVPLHRLEKGLFLESSALASAARYGLPKNLIKFAQRYMNKTAVVKEAGHCAEPETLVSSGPREQEPALYEHHPTLPGIGSVTSGIFNGEIPAIDEKAVRLFIDEVGGEKQIKLLRLDGRPPIKDIGKSVLYLIKDQRSLFYVGETDDIQRRWLHHKADFSKKIEWALYCELPNKSDARSKESSLIRRLESQKIPMLSVNDGKR